MPSNKFNSVLLRDNDGSTRHILYALKWIMPALFISVLIPLCTGYPGMGSFLLTFISLCLARFNRIAFYTICSLLFLLILYIPVGYDFGRINFAFVVSGMQTNYSEALEFFNDISFAALLLFSAAMAFLILYGRGRKYFSSKYSLFFLIAFIAINFNSYPIRMLKAIVSYTQEARAEFARLNTLRKPVDNFTVSNVSDHYKNIVVIVGESVTRDYMSLYGYEKNTTPWLNNAHGYFFSGYTSAAPNTFLSLPRTLAISDGINVDEGNNIISLANKAGFETWWISNQGYLGMYDTPATALASNAQHTTFLKKGTYNSNDVDDFSMLTDLQKIVKTKGSKQNVTFMHMIGSHPDTCSRLNGYPVRFDVGNEKINCYLATIQKLDAFVEATVNILTESNEPYVLFYFSDHGMTVDKSERPVRHGGDAHQNYNVPFFVITNDVKEHIVDNRMMSARDFISVFEHYVGFSSDKVAAKDPAEIQNKTITVFNGDKLVPYDYLKDNDLIH